MSLDIENAMLFESAGIAESVAAHLRSIGVASGIKTKLGEWKAQTRAKFPPIIGTAPLTVGEKVWASRTTDAFGHAKLGGIGDLVSAEVQKRTAQYNQGREVNIINQKLGYLVRGGDPDAIDSIVPMAYGNLAFDLLLKGTHGRLVVVKNGCYGNIPLDIVTSSKKLVNVERYYNTERYRPHFNSFDMAPLFIMTSEG